MHRHHRYDRVWVPRRPRRPRSTSRRWTPTSSSSSGRTTLSTTTSSIWRSARSEVNVYDMFFVLEIRVSSRTLIFDTSVPWPCNWPRGCPFFFSAAPPCWPLRGSNIQRPRILGMYRTSIPRRLVRMTPASFSLPRLCEAASGLACLTLLFQRTWPSFWAAHASGTRQHMKWLFRPFACGGDKRC